MMKADKHVLHALRSKQSREGQWKLKMVKHGVVRWKEKFEIAKEAPDSSKWEKDKKNIKDLLFTQRSAF